MGILTQKNPLTLHKYKFTFITFMGMFSYYTHHPFVFTMPAHMTITYQLSGIDASKLLTI
jgi:hypothetical protein